AAFVDIGLEKAAFLHASDIVNQIEQAEGLARGTMPVADIGQLVRPGQHILVQVVKDPLGTKGARLTTDITIPSRYMVLMPQSPHVGISQRIEDEQERNRLKQAALPYCDDEGGFIVRTAAEGDSTDQLQLDATSVRRLCVMIQRRRQAMAKTGLVYDDLNLYGGILRDFVGEEIERSRVDSRVTYDLLKECV